MTIRELEPIGAQTPYDPEEVALWTSRELIDHYDEIQALHPTAPDLEPGVNEVVTVPLYRSNPTAPDELCVGVNDIKMQQGVRFGFATIRASVGEKHDSLVVLVERFRRSAVTGLERVALTNLLRSTLDGEQEPLFLLPEDETEIPETFDAFVFRTDHSSGKAVMSLDGIVGEKTYTATPDFARFFAVGCLRSLSRLPHVIRAEIKQRQQG